MRCDALTELEADRIANLLRCPRCGTPGRSLRSRSSWSPAQAAPARAPSWTAYAVGCRTARSLRLTSSSRSPNSAGQVAGHVAAPRHGIALNGRATVLCGSLQSEQLEPLPARPLVGDIHFCNLDCPDDVLAERLRARPAWRGWNEQRIAEHQRFAASLRARIEPTFDTSAHSVEEVADQVARWVT